MTSFSLSLKKGRAEALMEGSRDQHVQAMRAIVHSLAGDVDTAGIELMSLVRVVANHCDAVVDDQLGRFGLSGPRWVLLLRLMAEERRDGAEGTSPTRLSRCQDVSKNTISALLRGLEEQGLVERSLDPVDKRVFRIRLTQAGRERIQATVAGNVLFFNHLVSGLSPAERAQLIELLAKLHGSMAHQRQPGGM